MESVLELSSRGKYFSLCCRLVPVSQWIGQDSAGRKLPRFSLLPWLVDPEVVDQGRVEDLAWLRE